MATESPIRISETSGKWGASFAPLSSGMAAEELGLLKNGHFLGSGSGKSAVPDRSGSAPPSIEGSFLAIDDVMFQQNSGLRVNFGNFIGDFQNYESEGRLQADPAYLRYYSSKVNLNPRLPRTLNHHLNRIGSNSGLTSLDDSGNRSFCSSQVTLSTHMEESEDDSSPKHPSDEMVDRNNGFWSRKEVVKVASQSRNLVSAIQEDIPCSSSPVYNQSHYLGYGMTEEEVDNDSYSSPLRNGVSKAIGSRNIRASSKVDVSAAYASSSSSRYCTESKSSSPPTEEVTSNVTNIGTKDEVVDQDINHSEISVIISNIKDLNMGHPNLRNQKSDDQPRPHLKVSSSSQVQSGQPQISSRGVVDACAGMIQFHHGPSKASTMVQPVVQSSGFTPPLYASAAAYMTSPNSFYCNVQSPGIYSPQYVMNSSLGPPLVSGYPPHGGVPFVLDGVSGPSFHSQTSGVPSRGNIVHGSDMQHLNKFNGQFGFSLQPSFVNPLHAQYYPQPFGEAYGIAGEVEPLGSRVGVLENQLNAHDLQEGSEIAAFDVQKYPHYKSGESDNPISSKVSASPYYMGNPPNMRMYVHYPSSPLASPVLPGLPVMGTCLLGGRNEPRISPGSSSYSGWQGQRGFESYKDPKISSFLEELKSGKGRRFELFDITGHIVEFSADQHGSRFIQQKLENCSVDEKTSVFEEVLPYASRLITDVFGNYVIQKFFEYGSPAQRKELTNQLIGQVLPLSLQMYGCRVIQKALETIELEQKAQLVHELDGNVIRCVRDQNGNHVIQKCIECVPPEKIGFIISAFRGQVATLSMHPYGCRVIQRVLEHCPDMQQCQFLVDEILDNGCALAQDQYGNYVTQHVLQRGKPLERSKIIRKLSGQFIQLSQHKFASNVVEKCLVYGGTSERQLIIDEVLGHNEENDILLTMMKDQFGNYVVQKIFELCSESQQAKLHSHIRTHAHVLKKYTYGKHIVARFEMLFGEENQTP